VTEPEYFDAFRRQERNRLVDVIIDDHGGVPKTIVERAAALKKDADKEAQRSRDDNLKYDEVWCVFDLDDHPNVPDARQQARDNQIEIALSNPSFELWLLLHFCDQNAHIDRKAALSALKKYISKYDKHVPFELLQSRYSQAVNRARLLEKRGIEIGEEGGNPSTTVYRLTERITEFGLQARTRR
jgi:hypothetical protein